MRKIYILQVIYIAILISIYTLTLPQPTIKYIPYTTPSPAVIPTSTINVDIEQLKSEIQVLTEYNKQLKWYMDTFFSQAQREYMKRREK
jgi:hypothetical protein